MSVGEGPGREVAGEVRRIEAVGGGVAAVDGGDGGGVGGVAGEGFEELVVGCQCVVVGGEIEQIFDNKLLH